MKETNRLVSIIRFKCPRCRQGDLYINQNPYSFHQFFEMHKNCPVCNLKYEPEPGFFYGSMYVSYALSIIMSGLTWFILTILGFSFWVAIWTIIPLLIISIPLLFKISRVIWISFFIQYDSQITDGAK